MVRSAHLVLLALFATGCGAPPSPLATPASASPTPSAAATVEDPHLAPPFTADEIRKASKTGRTYEFLVEQPPEAPTRRRVRFADVSDVGAMIETTRLDKDGNQVGDKELAQATWDELKGRTVFLRSTTTVDTHREDVPAGSYDCRCYVTRRAEEKTTTCFAVTLPGLPVVTTTEIGDRVVSTTSLLSIQE